ncbi:hypothetical protein OWM54_25720 [Myxococcus sp. MISCRS1]|uniref:hypothetical protein n=1 Tax=Myxococcus sp. MISCRS1 TaxID=2996786 RepID=UPI00226F84B6|nr:hypothetical protein [Myxococcus sp. MISCRS1]MCY1000548.1 hypothetical protein [Myxococcus sp. MISCRS1]
MIGAGLVRALHSGPAMRRILPARARLWLLGLILVAPLATVECVYRYALTRLPELPPSPTQGLTPSARQRVTWWRDFSPDTERVQPVWSWTVVQGLLRVALSPPSLGEGLMPEGFEHARDAADRWLRVLKARDSVRYRGLERVALAIWLTRHWDEADWRVAAIESRWHASSVRRGVPVFLARSWTQLPVEDLALLMALGQLSWRVDPWCEQEQLHAVRDALLWTLHDREGLDETALATALRAPLFLTVRPIDWGTCGQPALTRVLESRVTTPLPE